MSKRMFIPDGTPVLVTEYYILTQRNIETLNMVVCSATNVESCLCLKVPREFLNLIAILFLEATIVLLLVTIVCTGVYSQLGNIYKATFTSDQLAHLVILLYSCHPRSKHRLEKSGFQLDPRVRVNEPLGFNDYNKLQMNALAIVSDSGTLPEESSFYLSIGHPIAAVCIRTSTERPEALEAGDFILAGITTRELLNATDMAIEMKQKGVLGKPHTPLREGLRKFAEWYKEFYME